MGEKNGEKEQTSRMRGEQGKNGPFLNQKEEKKGSSGKEWKQSSEWFSSELPTAGGSSIH